MQRKVLGTAAVVLAIGMAGCGGGGGDTSKPLTRAEFTKAANGVCNRALAKNMRESHIEPVAQVIHYQQMKAQGIASLAPPPALERRFGAYSRFLAIRLDFVQRNRAEFETALRTKHVVPALQAKITAMQLKERRLAGALGLVDCRYHA